MHHGQHNARRHSSLSLPWLGTVAGNDLDSVRTQVFILKLKGGILDDECPDLVAEAIRVEMTLEREARLDFFLQRFGGGTVIVCEDLHGELRRESTFLNHVVQGLRQRTTYRKDHQFTYTP